MNLDVCSKWPGLKISSRYLLAIFLERKSIVAQYYLTIWPQRHMTNTCAYCWHTCSHQRVLIWLTNEQCTTATNTQGKCRSKNSSIVMRDFLKNKVPQKKKKKKNIF